MPIVTTSSVWSEDLGVWFGRNARRVAPRPRPQPQPSPLHVEEGRSIPRAVSLESTQVEYHTRIASVLQRQHEAEEERALLLARREAIAVRHRMRAHAEMRAEDARMEAMLARAMVGGQEILASSPVFASPVIDDGMDLEQLRVENSRLLALIEIEEANRITTALLGLDLSTRIVNSMPHSWVEVRGDGSTAELPPPPPIPKITEERKVVCQLIEIVAEHHDRMIDVGHRWGPGKTVTAKPPKEFFCPISLQVMKVPSTIYDGSTYDHHSISKWWRTSNCSPVTNAVAPTMAIFENRALYSLTDSWPEQNLKVLINACNVSVDDRGRIARLQATIDYINCIVRDPANLMCDFALVKREAQET